MARYVGSVVRPGETYTGKQGPDYTPGVSAESVGAAALWLGSVTLPAGGGLLREIWRDHVFGALPLLGGES